MLIKTEKGWVELQESVATKRSVVTVIPNDEIVRTISAAKLREFQQSQFMLACYQKLFSTVHPLGYDAKHHCEFETMAVKYEKKLVTLSKELGI